MSQFYGENGSFSRLLRAVVIQPLLPMSVNPIGASEIQQRQPDETPSAALNVRQIPEKAHPTAGACCTSRTLWSGWLSCRVRRWCVEDKLGGGSGVRGGGDFTHSECCVRGHLLGRGVNSNADPLTILVVLISTRWYS